MKLGLFATRDGVSTGTTVTLFADRNVTFEGATTGQRPERPVAQLRLQPPGKSSAAGLGFRPGRPLPVAVLRRPSRIRPGCVGGWSATPCRSRTTPDLRPVHPVGRGAAGNRRPGSPRVGELADGSGSRVPARPLASSGQGDDPPGRARPKPAIHGVTGCLRSPHRGRLTLVFRFRVPMDPALSNGNRGQEDDPLGWCRGRSIGVHHGRAVDGQGNPATVDDAAWVELWP